MVVTSDWAIDSPCVLIKCLVAMIRPIVIGIKLILDLVHIFLWSISAHDLLVNLEETVIGS